MDAAESRPAASNGVVHVMDRACPPEVIEEALLLARPGEKLICIGPLPESRVSPLESAPVTKVSLTELEFHPEKVPAELRGGRVVYQCWSVQAGGHVRAFLSDESAPIALRLARPPSESEAGQLLELAGDGKLAVACPTEFVAARLPTGDLAAEVRVIPPPGEVDAAARSDASRRSRLRRQLGIAPAQVAIAAPGPVHRGSGHRYVVWATAILVVGELPVRLIVPHTGREARNVVEFARQAGFGERTQLAELRLPDVLAAADVAVFLDAAGPPPMPLAAAMCAGLPIVAARTPAAGEWLIDGRNALLVAPQEPRATARALMQVVEDKALAAKLGSAARSSAVAKFDLESIRRRWQQLRAGLQSPPAAEA